MGGDSRSRQPALVTHAGAAWAAGPGGGGRGSARPVLKRASVMAPTCHCRRWAGTEGERWVAAGRASGLVGLGLQWGLWRQQIAWLRGRPARLWQEQEGVRGGAIMLYGDVIYSGGKKFRQALKSHAFQALVPLLFHLADSCPEVVTVSGLECLSSSAWVEVVSRHWRCR